VNFPWKIAGIAATLACSAIIARSVLAGPTTTIRPEDKVKATRLVAPLSGADERVPLQPPRLVGGYGLVEPADREIKVAAATGGRIAAIPVAEGQWVEAGQALVQLDASIEAASLNAAEADVAAARAELARVGRGLRKEEAEALAADARAAQARAELAAGVLARLEQLGDASSADQLDRARRQAQSDAMTSVAADARARAALGGRREEIEAARARLAAADARREQARASLERLTVKAPSPGKILQIKLRPGEYYTPGGADPLLILGDTRTLRARVDIDERDIARVRLGAPAFVTADAFPDQKFPGKIVQIGARIGRKNLRTDDPVERLDTKILEVVIELEERERLLPGLRVAGYTEG
jgi:multidrug resistance efflux pump